MTRLRVLFLTLGILALGVLVGLVLQSVWLGAFLGFVVALVVFIGFESRRGGNEGVNDESNGIEL